MAELEISLRPPRLRYHSDESLRQRRIRLYDNAPPSSIYRRLARRTIEGLIEENHRLRQNPQRYEGRMSVLVARAVLAWMKTRKRIR